MGAEHYYPPTLGVSPPRPCPDCGEMVPANWVHLHRTWWEQVKEWVGYWWWRIKEDDRG